MAMANPLKNKVLILLLVLFVVVIALSTSPWLNKIAENIRPEEPNVTAIYLGSTAPGGTWQFEVEDRVLTDCTVAYIYNYTTPGKLVVYELDSNAFRAINSSVGVHTPKCKGGLIYGYLAVNFTTPPETLTIDVWVGTTSTNDGYIYFRQIGDWMFINGSYVGYKASSLSNNYILMSIQELERITNSTGIRLVNRR
ncbi:hypothetical protein [Thermococcus stetteri]|uniref:hypothetical protein n=1 Tax=Thermococcus stetteri TaxID=49900 RepID=UPI001AE87DE0|nr:hypothetical protein [Thermococcus stetteri]MBP1912028.1 hypothetical protein [Thermococcus stetteri]